MHSCVQEHIAHMLPVPSPDDVGQLLEEVDALASTHAAIRAGRAIVGKQIIQDRLCPDIYHMLKAEHCLLSPSGTAAALAGDPECDTNAMIVACGTAGSSSWLTALNGSAIGKRSLAMGFSRSGRYLGSVHADEDEDIHAAAFDTETQQWLLQHAVPLQMDDRLCANAQLCFNDHETLAATCLGTIVVIFAPQSSETMVWYFRVQGACELRWLSSKALVVLDCERPALAFVYPDLTAAAPFHKQVVPTWAPLGRTGLFEGAHTCMDVLSGKMVVLVQVALAGVTGYAKALFKFLRFDSKNSGTRSHLGYVQPPETSVREGHVAARVSLAPNAVAVESGYRTTVYSVQGFNALGPHSTSYRHMLVSACFSSGGHFLAGFEPKGGVAVIDARTGACLVALKQSTWWTGSFPAREPDGPEQELDMPSRVEALTVSWGLYSSQLHTKAMTANACAPSPPRDSEGFWGAHVPYDDPNFGDLIFSCVDFMT